MAPTSLQAASLSLSVLSNLHSLYRNHIFIIVNPPRYLYICRFPDAGATTAAVGNNALLALMTVITVRLPQAAVI